MIDAKQIPKEVVEAAARAMWRTDDPSQWEKGMAIVAIAAALNAWPDMVERHFPNDPTRVPGVFLPLPKEGE